MELVKMQYWIKATGKKLVILVEGQSAGQKVVANGTATLVLAMDSGRVSVSAAAILADADTDEKDAILDLDEKAQSGRRR